MEDFLVTDAGQHAALAKQFLEGALTLDEARPRKGKILFVPTLALAGHGLELLLKASILLNGGDPPTKGRKGHGVADLWSQELCEPVRDHVYANANLVVQADRENPLYIDVPGENEDILPLIEEYVVALGRLHGEDGYPLRYPSAPGKDAPRTPFLVKSLWRTADDLVKRPTDFLLDRFRGKVKFDN
ncbi:MAG: hypothetical protein H3C51_09850 [Rubellimicrobium sp.]|nr:hypothetical protein [Rubellimicrobium sp.]